MLRGCGSVRRPFRACRHVSVVSRGMAGQILNGLHGTTESPQQSCPRQRDTPGFHQTASRGARHANPFRERINPGSLCVTTSNSLQAGSAPSAASGYFLRTAIFPSSSSSRVGMGDTGAGDGYEEQDFLLHRTPPSSDAPSTHVAWRHCGNVRVGDFGCGGGDGRGGDVSVGVGRASSYSTW